MNENGISIATTNLTKVYTRGNEKVVSVNDVSFVVNK